MADVKAALHTSSSLPTIDHSVFPRDEYCRLRKELLAYTHERLTTVELARHVLDRTREHAPVLPIDGLRVLMLTPAEVGYQSGMLAHGLEVLKQGSDTVASVDFLTEGSDTRKPLLYKDRQNDITYAGGFSIAGRLSTPADYSRESQEHADEARGAAIRERMQSAGSYDLLIVSNEANQYCSFGHSSSQLPMERLELFNAYLERNPRTAVATVDGSDVMGCHDQFNQLRSVDAHFQREQGSLPVR